MAERLGQLGRSNHDTRPRFPPGELRCDIDGFSPHAKVRMEAAEREGLERLCRYVTRPPIQVERLSLAPDGKVIYALRRRWRNGTSAIASEPLDFVARLAALVPRPRAHPSTYHGVLAPTAVWLPSSSCRARDVLRTAPTAARTANNIHVRVPRSIPRPRLAD